MTDEQQKSTDSTGTARVTHELSEYESLEFDYDEDVALSVTTKTFQRYDSSITRDDVSSTVKVIRAARTGKVNIAAERHSMESKAESAVSKILKNVTDCTVEEVE